MKIYTFFTDTHKKLLYDYFIPSLYLYENNIELNIKKVPQACPSGLYCSSGWYSTMTEKVRYVIQACQENHGKIFIYSDCDVQFLGPFIDSATLELEDYDIACQDDVYPYENRNTYCAGFFICRSSDKTIKFFNTILNRLTKRKHVEGELYDDQNELNRNLHLVKHKPLSHKFYTIAQTTNALWDNNYDIENIPSNILVHHANWTHGVENKIKLLNLIKSKQL